MRNVSRALLLVLLLTVAAAGQLAPARAAGLPSRAQWDQDVATAMAGSWKYVDRRTSGARGRLAINLDIDNTALATRYGGGPTRAVLRFARHAHGLGVALYFNTGRTGAALRRAQRQLTRAGYPVAGVCGLRSATVTFVQSKKRCRARLVAHGYTIIANVGNNATDFAGGNYERAYRLPNYGGLLK